MDNEEILRKARKNKVDEYEVMVELEAYKQSVTFLTAIYLILLLVIFRFKENISLVVYGYEVDISDFFWVIFSSVDTFFNFYIYSKIKEKKNLRRAIISLIVAILFIFFLLNPR